MTLNKTRSGRKQRLRRRQAPLHVARKFVRAPLSKELRAKAGRRNAAVRKGDEVKVLAGKFKGVRGKVTAVKASEGRVFVEGAVVRRAGGREKSVALQASSLVILALRSRQAGEKTTQASTPVKPVESKPVQPEHPGPTTETKLEPVIQPIQATPSTKSVAIPSTKPIPATSPA